MASLGCRFSLDGVEDLDFDASELAARHVAFIKIEGDLLLEAAADSAGIQRALRAHQIDLIVTKVEDEIDDADTTQKTQAVQLQQTRLTNRAKLLVALIGLIGMTLTAVVTYAVASPATAAKAAPSASSKVSP